MRITDVIGMSISVITDWQGIIINPQFIRFDQTISWSKTPQFLDDLILNSNVLELVENRQFSFQVIENGSISGIFQIFYRYNQPCTEVEAAKLAFYSLQPLIPTNNREVRDEIEEFEIHDIGEHQIINSGNVEDMPVGWLRIDYAPKHVSDVIHNECHMHLSGFRNSRFVVCGLPTPKQFAELVMASFFPEIYKHHRLDAEHEHKVLTNLAHLETVNSTCIPIQDRNIHSYLSHFRIPTR